MTNLNQSRGDIEFENFERDKYLFAYLLASSYGQLNFFERSVVPQVGLFIQFQCDLKFIGANFGRQTLVVGLESEIYAPSRRQIHESNDSA